MTRLGYWLRMKFGLQIGYQCEHMGVCGCAGPMTVNDHEKVHGYCKHCTNPLIYCQRCGTGYLDREAPDPQNWEFSLRYGWRHVRPCTTT